jgi:hypothetical protein
MDLETAHSKSVPLERRNAILGEALRSRRAELRKYWRKFISPGCLESLGPIASEVEALLSGWSPARDWLLPDHFTWLCSEEDFSGGLQAIALARKIEWRPAEVAPAPLSLSNFKKLTTAESFQLLCGRYRCPLNIAAPSELEIAEELLRQLMVTDRAKIEAGRPLDAVAVLLRLNLVGIRALLARDLRSLDSLNYFYELPQRSWLPERANFHLLAFWLCIYAQLLSQTNGLKCASL